jgi:hypothetical protein
MRRGLKGVSERLPRTSKKRKLHVNGFAMLCSDLDTGLPCGGAVFGEMVETINDRPFRIRNEITGSVLERGVSCALDWFYRLFRFSATSGERFG